MTDQFLPPQGAVLCGKYRVERALGRGGMGSVVLATHLRLDRLVALKVLPTPGRDEYLSQRFVREARALARLSSDHVVKVLDLDETTDGAPVLVMEYLEGVDLEQRLAQGPPPTVEQALDWALQACAALAEAHARGVVHRDVKPANLFLVSRLDGAEQLKLLDFGISRVSGEDLKLTRTATGLGSPLFMSPEQLLSPRDVDARTDVWSLGVTLFRLVSGTAPYDAEDASTLAAQIAAREPRALGALRPQLPAPLIAAVMRALEKDVSRRWGDMIAFATALAPFASPGRLGSLELVRRSDALGRRAAPLGGGPGAPSGPRTLSHDIPRVVDPAPAHLVPAAEPTPSAPPRPAAAPARARWPVVLAAAAALALGVAAVRSLTAVPSPAAPPAPAPAPADVRAEPAAEPTAAPPPAAVPPPTVTVVGDKKPPREPKATPRPADPADPSNMEIKE